ncbi:hypothetical protein [Metabacillus arenae]|uniref:Uncharacterized protein n=1 Tax=Metabacillus arenae TaxID=2771434 RepID=A0A926RZL4_9BACI|nr:hypothetical protein [Metabacillus arenae]MBD1379174.1 hypothetical protein [Metabacillus arenae]
MNISNLQLNHTYKNYKQLCEVLEMPMKGGNAKKAQLKELERYFKYNKEGNKFIITHIYKVPLPKNNNKTQYISEIAKLILDKAVHQNNRGKLFISKSKLMSELRMVNENYAYAKYKQLRLAKHMNITIEEVEEFYLTSDDLLKRNIEAALNSLRSQSLIFWSHAMTLCVIETEAETNMNFDIKVNKYEHVNEFQEESTVFEASQPVSYRTYRKATDEEIELVLQVERDVLLKYKCDTVNDIYKRKLNKKFYKDVNDILMEHSNIHRYYNSYEIICNEKYIYSKWEELQDLQLGIEERETSMNNLNKGVMDRINTNVENRHNKAIDMINNDDVDNKQRVERRSNKKYKTNGFQLTDTLINKDALSLEEPFEKMLIKK